MKTGHEVVDEIGEITLYGITVPFNWYSHDLLANSKGTTNHLAVILLADIVNQYQPVEDYDDTTGQMTITWKKSFSGDELQVYPDVWGVRYGCPGAQILSAIKFLHKQNIVRLTQNRGRIFVTPFPHMIAEMCFGPKPAQES